MSLTSRLERADPATLAFLDAEQRWLQTARREQILPLEGWARSIACAGRGWGKTKTGANWLRRQAGMYAGSVCHVVAPTYSDLRGVIFEGPSGLLNAIPRACIRTLSYSPYPEIVLWNGSVIRGFSSETPDRLRGPQATWVWGDEIAAWQYADETMSNIDMSTRIDIVLPDGRRVQPQRFYTTTPRPLTWLKTMVEDTNTHVIRGTTYDNRRNLSEVFFQELEQYSGTRIGEQEIMGVLLDISESAIIKRSWLKLWPSNDPLPWFEAVWVSFDTAFSERTYDRQEMESDPTACTVWGIFWHNRRWNMMCLEAWSEYLGFPDLVKAAKKEMSATWGRKTETLFRPVIGPAWHQEQVKKADLLVIEDKGSGRSLRQQLSQEGIDSYPYNPGRDDKLQRLHAVSHVPFHGRVWLVESSVRPGKPRDWYEPMLGELCAYSGPGTTPHDDWIDSCSQIWRLFADRYMPLGAAALNDAPEAERATLPAAQPGDRDYVQPDTDARPAETLRSAYG